MENKNAERPKVKRKIIFVTHARPNSENVNLLSMLGTSQAQGLSENLKPHILGTHTAVLSSDRTRARATALIIAQALGITDSLEPMGSELFYSDEQSAPQWSLIWKCIDGMRSEIENVIIVGHKELVEQFPLHAGKRIGINYSSSPASPAEGWILDEKESSIKEISHKPQTVVA